ncbi:unnamed protein product [Phytophthora fragariaefolia]|uniref:Unnamed protein product n=1 Tax=Phytophthora fragariaefolia TaxID=1490495 RepID=A0A9W6XQ15_9STRA|nr:unnamed protein product [Phytophthora fragariaefolia]
MLSKKLIQDLVNSLTMMNTPKRRQEVVNAQNRVKVEHAHENDDAKRQKDGSPRDTSIRVTSALAAPARQQQHEKENEEEKNQQRACLHRQLPAFTYVVAHDEPVGRLDERRGVRDEHGEGQEDEDPHDEQRVAHDFDAAQRGQHEEHGEGRAQGEDAPAHAGVLRVQQRQQRVHDKTRVDGVVDDARGPGPEADLEAHGPPERHAHPLAEAAVGRERREELGERERQRQAPEPREQHNGQNPHERPAGRQHGLAAPRAAADVEVRDERHGHDAQLPVRVRARHGDRGLGDRKRIPWRWCVVHARHHSQRA